MPLIIRGRYPGSLGTSMGTPQHVQGSRRRGPTGMQPNWLLLAQAGPFTIPVQSPPTIADDYRPGSHIVAHHAYAVMHFTGGNVQLRNPWGTEALRKPQQTYGFLLQTSKRPSIWFYRLEARSYGHHCRRGLRSAPSLPHAEVPRGG